MKVVEALPLPGWEAALDLGFELRERRTVLARRASHGPLAIQKALYPEGDSVCQAILLHPPGGIAGGDRLSMRIDVGAGAHAQLTTPGATKWYRSTGIEASQEVDVTVAGGGVCEWLPQENIFFSSARAVNRLCINVEAGAAFCGWDVMCLGRTASGERFADGRIRQQWRVVRGGRLLFEETGVIEGGGTLLDSPVGMGGHPVCGTFIATGADIGRPLLDELRAIEAEGTAIWGVSALPQVLVGRFLGASAEVARSYFSRLWHGVRPHFANRMACVPRIWST
jgi:urease accessory protein